MNGQNGSEDSSSFAWPPDYLIRVISARPVHIILYCLGADAEDILLTTKITTEHRKKYQKVLEKFDKHFAVRRNVIFERARFNKSTHQQGESVEDYITVLHQLAGSCKCRNLKEEMI